MHSKSALIFNKKNLVGTQPSQLFAIIKIIVNNVLFFDLYFCKFLMALRTYSR